MELQFITITAANQDLLAPYSNIREKDMRREDNLFIAEGKVVLAALLESRRFQAKSLLVSARKLSGLLPLLRESPPHCPIYVAPQNLLESVAGFAMHRGIVAVAERRPSANLPRFIAEFAESGFCARRCLIVLSGIGNHDNVGAVFRNAAAFAADGVILDERCCDPLYRKAIRVSCGAALRVPYAQGGSITEIAAALRQAGFSLLAFSGRGEELLAEAAARHAAQGGRAALLFGSEGYGLPPAILERESPFYVPSARIPIAADWDSLNIATACGIALSAFADPAKLR